MPCALQNHCCMPSMYVKVLELEGQVCVMPMIGCDKRPGLQHGPEQRLHIAGLLLLC